MIFMGSRDGAHPFFMPIFVYHIYKMNLKDKKVLLMGLGILGGGVATARFLVDRGARLTVTDMKSAEYLSISLEKLADLKDKINFVLGEHREADFLNTDILVINPDVPADNKFVQIAREAGKPIENELTLFYKFNSCKTTVGITGTRGKTTTTNWIAHILNSAGERARVVGNDPEKPFLSEIANCDKETIAVVETPSFQLEIFGDSGMAPHVAVITNLYQDHLSRHKTMEGYALAKANIFKNQKEIDFLVLNKENSWTNFFLDQKPKSKVLFSSDLSILGFDKETFSLKFGEHNLKNFMMAGVACLALGVKPEQILYAINNLPGIKWRQELVYDRGGLRIYNDTASTSPEAFVSAAKRFKGQDTFFIVGGTDKELDFKDWAKFVKSNLGSENLVFLSGSATEKMKSGLGWDKFNEFQNLEECFDFALEKMGQAGTLVFSPGAKSFEKFKNEFDRGEKFNGIVKRLL